MNAPGKREYIAAADFLRVFAVGLVAWFHIWQQSWLNPGFRLLGVYIDLQRIIRRGYMAVDLMLLLSGFLLYLPAARSGEMPDTRTFYAKRLRRILPSYLAAVGIAFVFALLYGRNPGSAPLGVDLLAHLTFTHTFSMGTYYWTSLNGVLWTLAVEMQFYALFPLIGRAFLRRPGPTFAAMTLLALGCRAAISPLADVQLYFNQLPCMLDLYAFGMLSAHLLAAREWKKTPLAALGSAACLGLILWVLWTQSPADGRELNALQMLWRLPLAVLGAGFLWCGGLWPAGLARAAGNALTRWCAAISYNFYIWHQYLAVKLKTWHIPPYVTQTPQMSEGRAWQMRYTLACFAAALAAAALFTCAVERPAYRLTMKKTVKTRPD